MHPKLQVIKETMEEFQETYPEDVALILASDEEVVHYLPGKTIDLKLEAGRPVSAMKGSMTDEVLKNGQLIRREMGPETFGVAYVATSRPIYDGEKLIGVLSAAISIEKVDTLRNGALDLGAAVQQMSATTEEMLQASDDIAIRLQELTEQSEAVKMDIENINSVLALVRGIALQSNILGLNAAIEAARSGEHGRGFAVVAKEIRNMSDNSNARVLEIEKQLEVIKKAVDKMNESTNTIAAFTEEHNASMQELSVTYDRIGKTSELLLDASKI